MLMGSVQEKDSSPCGTEASLPARGIKHSLKGVLGRTVQSRRKQRRCIFHAFARAAAILGTAAGCEDPFSSVVSESAQQFKAGADPIQVFLRFPEFSRHSIPGQV